MRTGELLAELAKLPVFDTATVMALTAKDPAYVKLLLWRLKRAGRITQLQRGHFTVQTDPFIIASHMLWPSYISLWSALRYWNMTEQLPTAIWVITPRKGRLRTLRYRETAINIVHIKAKYFYGYKKVLYRGFEVFIAEPEKAIIDSLLLRRISLGEIAAIVRAQRSRLSRRRLIDWAVRTGNSALLKRFGWAAEAAGIDCWRRFKKFIYPTYIPLEWALPPAGRRNARWRVIENVR